MFKVVRWPKIQRLVHSVLAAPTATGIPVMSAAPLLPPARLSSGTQQGPVPPSWRLVPANWYRGGEDGVGCKLSLSQGFTLLTHSYQKHLLHRGFTTCGPPWRHRPQHHLPQNTRREHTSSARTCFSARTCLQVTLMSLHWLCASAQAQGEGEAGLADMPPSRGGSGTPSSTFWEATRKVTGLESSRGDGSGEVRARSEGAAVGFCSLILPPSCPPASLAATLIEVDSQYNKISYQWAKQRHGNIRGGSGGSPPAKKYQTVVSAISTLQCPHL